ncbi:MAG TPA: TIGR03067 domain-containing protein [Gemmataceae bacterium]|jgi:uncharacterized protein (TIGR03067 family)|nr:TIGR03067 domain-containing protein [Gemmataceae bacterium]
MYTRVVFPLVALCLIAADDPDKTATKDEDRFQGEWTMVSLEVQGKKLADAEIKEYRLTIKGDQWSVTNGVANGTDFKFKLDASKSPKSIDMSTKIDGEERASKGIYKLEDDTLTMCRIVAQNKRPTEFKTTDREGILVVWKRVKK